MSTIKTPTVIQTEGVKKPPKVINYPRTPDGLVDTEAYKGLKGTISVKNLNVDVVVNDARIRYGHLDLYVTPAAGTGEVWVERKNIEIYADPGLPFQNENENVEVPSFLAAPIQRLVHQIIDSEKLLTAP